MANFISMLPTILISIILAIVVVAIIVKLIKDNKNGKCSCGSSCGGCAMANVCHQVDDNKQTK